VLAGSSDRKSPKVALATGTPGHKCPAFQLITALWIGRENHQITSGGKVIKPPAPIEEHDYTWENEDSNEGGPSFAEDDLEMMDFDDEGVAASVFLLTIPYFSLLVALLLIRFSSFSFVFS
jgi:hypothetical protein